MANNLLINCITCVSIPWPAPPTEPIVQISSISHQPPAVSVSPGRRPDYLPADANLFRNWARRGRIGQRAGGTGPGLLNVTYRFYPVFVPHWIALHGVVLPRSEPKDEHEVSFEQEATKVTEALLPPFPSVQSIAIFTLGSRKSLTTWAATRSARLSQKDQSARQGNQTTRSP